MNDESRLALEELVKDRHPDQAKTAKSRLAELDKAKKKPAPAPAPAKPVPD